MSRSMLNVKMPVHNGSCLIAQNNSPFTTPHKSKPTSVIMNSSTLLRNTPHHY